MQNNVLKLVLFSLLSMSFLLLGCTNSSSNQAQLQNNEKYYNYIQSSFEKYQDVTRQWLTEHRQFISTDKQMELDFNSPFYLPSTIESNKAILLVHGLGDSPFYFSDIGKSLANAGMHVYSLLLPGHGSKPQDLMLPTYEDWQNIVDHYAHLLITQYDNVWLGGFSTGGNLVTITASENLEINGLLLFSPGFQSKAGFVEKLTPIAAMFSDWGWKTKEDNIARYNSTTFNGAMAYIESASELRKQLSKTKITIPTLLVLSAADSVVDPVKVHEISSASFTNSQSKVIWYGENVKPPLGVKIIPMRLPHQRISTSSHMGILFSPQNSHYGIDGSQRVCENGFNKEHIKKCEQGTELWFSTWGYEEKGKVHARLTWNPYYSDLAKLITRFIQ